MATKNSIKLFQDKIVRSIWDDEKEEWFFSVNDVVQILTDSTNVTDYIKKMRKRDEELSEGWGQIVTPFMFKLLEENKRRTLQMHSIREDKWQKLMFKIPKLL